MSDFIPVCKTTDIPDPGKDVFEIEGRFVVVFHLDREWFALDDCCTHDGGPLGQGWIEGFQIICPRHGARFDIRTGLALTMPAVHATAAHEVKIEGDQVFVKIKDYKSKKC
jgi:3-phenylpropionate/trans-cinnamate dioxygenase ferredoxin subunit